MASSQFLTSHFPLYVHSKAVFILFVLTMCISTWVSPSKLTWVKLEFRQKVSMPKESKPSLPVGQYPPSSSLKNLPSSPSHVYGTVLIYFPSSEIPSLSSPSCLRVHPPSPSISVSYILDSLSRLNPPFFHSLLLHFPTLLPVHGLYVLSLPLKVPLRLRLPHISSISFWNLANYLMDNFNAKLLLD